MVMALSSERASNRCLPAIFKVPLRALERTPERPLQKALAEMGPSNVLGRVLEKAARRAVQRVLGLKNLLKLIFKDALKGSFLLRALVL